VRVGEGDCVGVGDAVGQSAVWKWLNGNEAAPAFSVFLVIPVQKDALGSVFAKTQFSNRNL
jgi:hypothetical protein